MSSFVPKLLCFACDTDDQVRLASSVAAVVLMGDPSRNVTAPFNKGNATKDGVSSGALKASGFLKKEWPTQPGTDQQRRFSHGKTSRDAALWRLAW